MKLRITQKYDGNGRRMRRARPIFQDIVRVYESGRVRTSSGDTWGVRRTSKGLEAV